MKRDKYGWRYISTYTEYLSRDDSIGFESNQMGQWNCHDLCGDWRLGTGGPLKLISHSFESTLIKN